MLKKNSFQSDFKVYSEPLNNLPWQERPDESQEIIWRYSENPVIKRNALPNSNSIFNSAVAPYKDNFAGIFRVDDKRREMLLHKGFSKDGYNWEICPEPIKFKSECQSAGTFTFGYDPRLVFIEDRYWISWCNCDNGPTIGLGYTFDFKEFHQLPNAFPPFNRNGVLFPRKIDGKYAMLNRPSDNGHTPFGDIYYCESPDMRHWGYHREVMTTTRGWQETKIGAGPIPIETSEGWLLFYHGVLTSCNGYHYSFGAALLDLEQPWKVIARSSSYLISPQETYECVGDVPNVTFPCAALTDPESGRIAIYYGCADTVTSIAFCYADEVIDFIKNES